MTATIQPHVCEMTQSHIILCEILQSQICEILQSKICEI